MHRDFRALGIYVRRGGEGTIAWAEANLTGFGFGWKAGEVPACIWDGKLLLDSTVFEIAVTESELTPQQQRWLLR